MLLRLSYLALIGMIRFLRLLTTSNADKDIEILALRHQLAVLQRRVDKIENQTFGSSKRMSRCTASVPQEHFVPFPGGISIF